MSALDKKKKEEEEKKKSAADKQKGKSAALSGLEGLELDSLKEDPDEI